MPGSIKIDDGSGNYTILTNGGSLGSDKTITIPNLTGTVGIPETGTWTATIEYSTTLTETSSWSTTTLTGNYFKIGKWYRCSIPSISRSTMGLSADFIVNSVSLPATTASTNRTVAGVDGYSLGARYNTSILDDPQLLVACGGSATKISTKGLDMSNGGSGFLYCTNTGSAGNLHLHWDFVGA
jgi:hypothetical protein|tara:strand:+ start:2801 stop:3349 length:549 start_codon:yes stop_codon:yes gene_type:complete